MSAVKIPEPVILRTVMPDDYRYGHVYGYTRSQLEAYADAKVREALTWEDVWRLVRNTGYVTKGQADEITDLILARLRGAPSALGAQEGA